MSCTQPRFLLLPHQVRPVAHNRLLCVAWVAAGVVFFCAVHLLVKPVVVPAAFVVVPAALPCWRPNAAALVVATVILLVALVAVAVVWVVAARLVALVFLP